MWRTANYSVTVNIDCKISEICEPVLQNSVPTVSGRNPHATALLLVMTGNLEAGSLDDIQFLEKPIRN
jgi:hypothetical protein